MSTYVPVDFEDGVTPLNAATFNHLEDEVELLDALKVPDPTGLDEKWLKAEGGAMVWVDAPSGGSSIEYENVWNPATPYTPGDVVEHEGVEYLAVNPSTGDEPAPAAAPSPAVIPLVTALPASPFDGQEVILTDSLTTPNYAWRLRYRAGSTRSEKWEFVGGAPASATLTTQQSVPFPGPAVWTDVATVGPSFTVPRTGLYQCRAECFFLNDAGANQQFIQAGLGIGAFDGAGVLLQAITSFVSLTNQFQVATYGYPLGLTQGAELRMRYMKETASAASVLNRILTVTPVRLS